MSDNIPKEPVVRKRNFFVTFWLIYILFSGVSSVFSFSLYKKEVEKILEIEFSQEFAYMMIIIGALSALSAFLLILWKKIGFHILIVSNIISLYVSIQMGGTLGSSIMSLTQIALTYMILQLHSNGRTAWSWLK